MKVYIVILDYTYEGYGEPQAAFTSEQKAKDYIREKYKIWDTPEIFELELK